MAVVGPGEGELIFDTAGRRVVLMLDRDDLALTVNVYHPGEQGPRPHVHRRHADCFWVHAGELAFAVGPDGVPLRVGAGTGIVLPPQVTHSFSNAGAADALFVNVHAPAAGFAAYMRGLRDARDEAERAAVLDAFDQYDPPPGGGEPETRATHGAGLLETPFARLAATDLPDGGELDLAPGLGCVYVLDGAVAVDGERAPRGALAVVEGPARLRAAEHHAQLLLIGT